LASLALIGVWPAFASFPPTVTLIAPGEGAKWVGAPSDFHVIGHGDTDDGSFVTRVSYFVDPTDANTKHFSDTRGFPGPNEAGSSAHQNFDFSVFPDLNGAYKLTVAAYGKSCGILGCGSEQQGPPVVRTLTLAVPPKMPTGAVATLADGKVTFGWDKNNTEADLLGYVVERADPGADDFKCLRIVERNDMATKYVTTDDLKEAATGDYRYRVRALRKANPDSTLGTCSKSGGGLMSTGTAASKVTWKNPTDPTTTTTPGGGGGTGGGGGGKGSTSSTIPKRSSGGGTDGPAPKKPNLAALGGLSAGTNIASAPNRRVLDESDPGFNDFLPFGNEQADADQPSGDLPQTALPAADDGNGRTTTLLFIAAGLLATVLSMHVLWLKAQVDRMPLEALTPEDVPLT
jgi:hypothetical protein